jgi:hypothetical protein
MVEDVVATVRSTASLMVQGNYVDSLFAEGLICPFRCVLRKGELSVTHKSPGELLSQLFPGHLSVKLGGANVGVTQYVLDVPDIRSTPAEVGAAVQ